LSLLRCFPLAGCKDEPVQIDRALVGTPGVQLVDDVECHVDLAPTGVGLCLLDDQPLVMDVDRSPSQLAELGDSQAGLGHDRDHWATADLTITPSASVHLSCSCEELDQLVGFEYPPQRARGFEPAALPAGRVGLEASSFDCAVEGVRE